MAISEQDKNLIAVLYTKGFDCREIGLRVNFSTSEVSKFLKKEIRIGKLDKEKVIEEFRKGTPLLKIANVNNLMYADVFSIVNAYRKKGYTYLTGTFSKKEGQKKFKLDKDFFQYLKAKSVIDAFAGTCKTYPKEVTLSNDINKAVKATYHMDANKFLNSLTQTADLVDLDPFGCCNNCWEQGIRLANRGIIITYGEVKVWRYHCKDYEYWGKILGENLKDYATSIHSLKYALIKRTIELGEEQGKKLRPWHVWMPMWTWLRVYYEIM